MTKETSSSEAFPPERVEVDQFKDAEATENPLAAAFNISVSIPETIQIEMVNVSSLNDYEVWILISSLLANVVVGFAMAFIQGLCAAQPLTAGSALPQPSFLSSMTFVYLICATASLLLFTISIIKAYCIRQDLKKGSKKIKLRTTQVESDQ